MAGLLALQYALVALLALEFLFVFDGPVELAQTSSVGCHAHWDERMSVEAQREAQQGTPKWRAWAEVRS